MRFKIYDMENTIYFEDDYVYVLELCNKQYYIKTISNLYLESNGFENLEPFVFEHNGKILKLKDDAVIIGDPFCAINLQKQSSAKLIKYIVDKMNNTQVTENLSMELIKIKQEFESIFEELDIEIEYNDMADIPDLVKMLSPKIKVVDFGNVFETYNSILKVISVLNVAKMVILLDIKKFLSNKQLTKLYQTAKIYGISLLLIESTPMHELLDYEYKITVDEDMYEYVTRV